MIVESPSKAKTIKKYLGKDFEVYATAGHVIDLPKSSLAVDIDDKYRMDFVVMDGKKKILSSLKKSIKDADNIYLAMDPDREGEAIAYHVASYLKIKDPKRVMFNEISQKSVKNAVQSFTKINDALVQSQFARRALDRLIGYKLSQVLWKKMWFGLSAGRVQSVALKIVVEREKEITNFVPEKYFGVYILHTKSGLSNKFILTHKDGKKFTPKDPDEVKSVLKRVESSNIKIDKVVDKEFKTSPPPAFITSTLQQAASNVLGYSPSNTMKYAQKLYQNGYITYMRTDSVNLSNDAIAEIRKYIDQNIGPKYLASSVRMYKSKVKGAQEAHEAIRPVSITVTPDEVESRLDSSSAKLYSLIRNRAIATQMAEAKMLRSLVYVDIIDGSKYSFTLKGEQLLFDGYLKLWNNRMGEVIVSKYSEGELLEGAVGKSEKLETKPKARYSEAGLVKMLEKYGVGRPSTYATIITTIIARGYVVKEGKTLFPTDIGIVVSDYLTKRFFNLVDYNYTATVEEELDSIETLKNNYFDVVDAEYSRFSKDLEIANRSDEKSDILVLDKTEQKCDICGSKMVVKLGRNGKFLSCSKFPECKGIRSLEEISVDSQKYLIPEKCPLCSKAMVLKKGKFGLFWACSDYPTCKGIQKMLLREVCPECGSHLVERKGKWKKSFIGCSNYPKCRFISSSLKTPSISSGNEVYRTKVGDSKSRKESKALEKRRKDAKEKQKTQTVRS